MSIIDEEAFRAMQEHLASCTVGITSEIKGFEHGTGVAVRYDGIDYILTAAHVLNQERDNRKIMVLGRPNAPLRDVTHKGQLARTMSDLTSGPMPYSTATHVEIISRHLSTNSDSAAIVIKNAKRDLPHTLFYDLSGQGNVRILVNRDIIIFGFPGELALQVQHRKTGHRAAMAVPFMTTQKISNLSEASRKLKTKLDPTIDFVSDFTDDDSSCRPQGMSGCGGWSVPKIEKAKLWSPCRAQLLGIQIGFYSRTKLLQFVRINSILKLLSGLQS